MPPVLVDVPSVQPIPEPPRKRWTRAECAALEEYGVLGQQRVELVQGELISKIGKKRPQVNAAYSVYLQLARIFGAQLVNQEVPIDVSSADNPRANPNRM